MPPIFQWQNEHIIYIFNLQTSSNMLAFSWWYKFCLCHFWVSCFIKGGQKLLQSSRTPSSDWISVKKERHGWSVRKWVGYIPCTYFLPLGTLTFRVAWEDWRFWGRLCFGSLMLHTPNAGPHTCIHIELKVVYKLSPRWKFCPHSNIQTL